MIFLDTSILIRYFTGDDPHKAQQAEVLFRHAQAGRVTLYVTHLMLAETVWVLSKTYHMPKALLVENLCRLLSTPHVTCDETPLMLAALELFASQPISFIDAYHATLLPAHGISTLYSYDTDFDQVAGLTRREP